MKEEKEKVEVPLREILITTDGEKIDLVKAEVSGTIELVAILQAMIRFLTEESANKRKA